MINKNQYKVRNVKKILHKVGKNWLVVSTALLGMVAGGAAAGTATHADPTPANANHSDGYVNHQVTQSAGSASPQLVHSDGTSLASASTGSSVASNNVSPSASKSTMSSVAPSASSQGNNVNSESIGLNHRALGAVPKSMTSTSSDSANYLNLNGFNSLVSQMVTGYFPYPEFSNYIENKVYKDICNNTNVNDFLSKAASQVDTCFLTAPHKDNYHLIQPIKDTIKSTLSSLGKSPEFSDEYSTLSEGAILPFLRNLGSITSDNLVGPLSNIASDTSVNAINIPGFGEIASDAKSLANNASLVNEVYQHRINEFNNEASKINNQHFVSDTINAIVHLSSSQAKSFKSLCSDLTSYINSSDIGSFVDNTLSNSNLSAFTDSYAKNIHKLLNLLNNSDVESLYKKDYDQFHENRGRNIQRLLVQDLANVAGNDNNANVASILKDFNYSIYTWGFTSNDKIPWMKTIYNGINDYLSSLKSQKSTTSALNNSVTNGKAKKPSSVPSSPTSVDSKSNSLNSASMDSQNSANSTQPSVKSSNASTTHSSNTNSGNKTKSASPSSTDHSTQPSNPAKPNGSSDDENDKPSTNPNGVSPSGNPKSVPSAGTGHSAKPSDSVKPNNSNVTPSRASYDDGSGKSSTNSDASYLASLSNSKSEQSKLASEASVSNNISASESVASASAAASESSEEAARSLLNSIISAQSDNKDPQTSFPDNNNSASPSTPNDNDSNNTSASSSNNDSSSPNQPQVNFTNNASSSSAVQNSAPTAAKSSVSNVNQLSVGQQADYHGVTVTRKRSTYRWFEISKTCLAHNTLDSVGKIKDYGAVLSPGMKVRLDKIFKVNVGHRTVYRYEINISGHDYFVTGNHHFTNDAYYQASDFKGHRAHGRYGHRYFEAVVKKPFSFYDSAHFNKANQLWMSHRGQLIDIKGVHKIGNVTRLALIDGTYITANREFLKLI